MVIWGPRFRADIDGGQGVDERRVPVRVPLAAIFAAGHSMPEAGIGRLNTLHRMLSGRDGE